MIQICLHLSLEAHRHKELIVLQHSIPSLKGLASYSPFAGKFFRKMLFINWHRNCNVKLQASCLLWHRSYGYYLFQVSVNTLDSNGGSAGGRILYGPHKGWKSISPQPLPPLQRCREIPSQLRWWTSVIWKDKLQPNTPVWHCSGAHWISGAADVWWVSDSRGFTEWLTVSFFKYSCACRYWKWENS